MSFSYLGKSSILKDLESDEKLQDILKETEEELIKPILSGEVPSVNVQDFAEVVSAHNQYPPYDFEKARQEHKNAEYYVSDEYLEKSKEFFIKCYPQYNLGDTRGGQRPRQISSPEDYGSYCDGTDDIVAPMKKGDTYKNRRWYWQENMSGYSREQISQVQQTRDRLFWKIKGQLEKHYTFVKHHQIPQNYFWYKGPNAYMGWHTNCETPGPRLYLVWSDEDKKSYMRYQDIDTGEVKTVYEKKGWNFNQFTLTGPCKHHHCDTMLWHSIFSNCNRISLAFKVWY
tara:strand:+ start:586 stop:1440 length:855 start_codon:yes stop_codon:yes gene_type:complete